MRAKAGVQVDPRQAPCIGRVAGQDRAGLRSAPAGRPAAIEHAVRDGVLAARHRIAQGRLAVCRKIPLQRRLVGCVRRPGIRQQQRVDLEIGRVGRRDRGEIDAVAVQVDVVFVHPPQMRESVRVDRMDQQQRHPAGGQPCEQRVVAQQADLAAGTAEPSTPWIPEVSTSSAPGLSGRKHAVSMESGSPAGPSACGWIARSMASPRARAASRNRDRASS